MAILKGHARSIDGVPEIVDNYAEAIAISSSTLATGDIVDINGRLTSGDGGGGRFKFTVYTSGAPTADGGTVLAHSTIADGYLERLNVTSPTIKWFGSDDAGVDSAEASTNVGDYIDLDGQTVYTDLRSSDLTKKYYNGKLYATNADGTYSLVRNNERALPQDFGAYGTKSLDLTLGDESEILWLGTSIPHQGAGTDGYPELVGKHFGANVDNQAWSGSHASYDGYTVEATEINDIKCLSMTDDDRVAGLALWGSSSPYDDSYNVVTLASQMTCDYRIKARMAAATITHVFLDHNHNDRRRALGTLTPTSTSIVSITKGSTTQIELSSVGSIVVGSGVTLRVTGIGDMDHWSGMVTAVSSNTITINLDTSSYSGSFSSGTCYDVDRATVYGAWFFLYHYINWCSIINDYESVPQIILNGAPSEYTNGTFDDAIYGVNDNIRIVAEDLGLSYFDQSGSLGIASAAEQSIYFPDDVHPTTLKTRQVVANHWIKWIEGGVAQHPSPNTYLPRGNVIADVDQSVPVYSAYFDGYSTPSFMRGAYADVLADDFTGGLGSWTTLGTAPTIVNAPWNASEKALFMDANSGAGQSEINQSISSTVGGWKLDFSLYVPTISGVNTSGSNQYTSVAKILTTGAYLYVSIFWSSDGEKAYAIALLYPTPNTGPLNYFGQVEITAGVKHSISLEFVQKKTDFDGAATLYVDGKKSGYATLESTAHGAPATLRIGTFVDSSVGDFEVYISDVDLDRADTFDGAYSGTAASSATLNIVNGLIVSVS